MFLRETLVYFKSLTTENNSLIYLVDYMIKLCQEKYTNTFNQVGANTKQTKDLDAEEDIENLYFNSLQITFKDKKSLDNSKRQEELNAALKLTWDSFILALDMQKLSDKLYDNFVETVYKIIDFCKHNQRTIEFRRLVEYITNNWGKVITK